jgi:pyruvate-formate lyase-activating enzyme
MISYYPSANLSLSEIKGQTTLSFHGITGCMFHCYHCFNYDDLILHPPKKRFNIDDVISQAKQQESLVDAYIFSGAEFLMASLDDIIHDLSLLKTHLKKPIILYTTGAFFEKLKYIVDHHLVDGVHIDMKLPYHLLTEDDDWIIKKTMGVDALKKGYIDACMKSIEYVIQHDQGLSQIRSVRYPFLDDSAFNASESYIQALNQQFNKHTPYEVHPFYDVNM